MDVPPQAVVGSTHWSTGTSLSNSLISTHAYRSTKTHTHVQKKLEIGGMHNTCNLCKMYVYEPERVAGMVMLVCVQWEFRRGEVKPGASWLCMDEAECWCVYSPNTPAVFAERVAGSLPGIPSSCMTTHTQTCIHPHTQLTCVSVGWREISQQANPSRVTTYWFHAHWLRRVFHARH